MWKYVSRRVKDSIELGINVRKSFTIQQNLSNQTQEQQQKQQYERQKHHLHNCNVVPRHQDPSRDKDKRDERFKKKYDRLHQNQRCFLNALTWSTALITGFYASQLLCLYRRNQRLALDGSRCYYSKYLLSTTQSIHRNVKYLLTSAGQQTFLPALPKLECPLKKAKQRSHNQSAKQPRSVEDEFKDFKHFVDPEYNRYQRFFETGFASASSTNVYNVSNDNKSEISQLSVKKTEEEVQTVVETPEERENSAIDEAIRQLATIVGELEFQMGVESVSAGHFDDAVDHFKLSTSHNHPGGAFNLALCYEQGVGVKRNMKTARRLYEIASGLGHAKAFYNLGVFHAQGIGGVHKNANQARKYFEQAAELGNIDAMEALSLLIPRQKKLPIIEETTDEELFYKEKSLMSSTVSAMANHGMMRRIAVT